MLYLIRANRRQQESRRTAAALEAVLDTYERHCAKLRAGTELIENHLEKDQPHDTNP
jgi:hypothetical protein